MRPAGHQRSIKAIHSFTASYENMNRYWRLVLTLPKDGEPEGKHQSLFMALAAMLLPTAKAETATVVITIAYPSLLVAESLPLTDFTYEVYMDSVSITGYSGSEKELVIPPCEK